MQRSGTSCICPIKSCNEILPNQEVPIFSKSFVVETDASNNGIEVVLSQEGMTIAFFSLAQGLSERVQNNSVYEMEFMALVYAMQNGGITG